MSHTFNILLCRILFTLNVPAFVCVCLYVCLYVWMSVSAHLYICMLIPIYILYTIPNWHLTLTLHLKASNTAISCNAGSSGWCHVVDLRCSGKASGCHADIMGYKAIYHMETIIQISWDSNHIYIHMSNLYRINMHICR